jgi:arsenate reductase-like glutaredoxin family protein
MTTINRIWHKQHPLPKKATSEQMRAWHEAHQKECGCRPVNEMPPTKPLPKMVLQQLDTGFDCN